MSKIQVLAVDDNGANLYVLSAMLKKMGFLVDEAKSGMDAISLFCQKDYDIIFVDHLMPEMDGIVTIRQLLFLADHRKKPVIFGISATVDKEVEEVFFNVGAVGVIEKPFEMNALEEIIKKNGFSVQMNEMPSDAEESVDTEELFGKVTGLNYQKGIALLGGSVEQYIKVLQVSIRNIKENDLLLNAIRETRQMERFNFAFHSLKGIFLNIGAETLGENSRVLEEAAKNDEIEIIRQELDFYTERVARLVEDLEKVCKEYRKNQEEEAEVVSISEDEFERKMMELREQIDNFEYIEITDTLEYLLQHMEQGEKRKLVEKIEQAISDFRYEDAITLLEERSQ